jgi:hypothetical protein
VIEDGWTSSELTAGSLRLDYYHDVTPFVARETPRKFAPARQPAQPALLCYRAANRGGSVYRAGMGGYLDRRRLVARSWS